jgi:hypothetical protein
MFFSHTLFIFRWYFSYFIYRQTLFLSHTSFIVRLRRHFSCQTLLVSHTFVHSQTLLHSHSFVHSQTLLLSHTFVHSQTLLLIQPFVHSPQLDFLFQSNFTSQSDSVSFYAHHRCCENWSFLHLLPHTAWQQFYEHCTLQLFRGSHCSLFRGSLCNFSGGRTTIIQVVALQLFRGSRYHDSGCDNTVIQGVTLPWFRGSHYRDSGADTAAVAVIQVQRATYFWCLQPLCWMILLKVQLAYNGDFELFVIVVSMFGIKIIKIDFKMTLIMILVITTIYYYYCYYCYYYYC